MPNSQVRSSERVADMWTKKGSWLLLVGVALSMFMAGAGVQAYFYSNTVAVLQASFDKKETDYRVRIDDLNAELKALIPKVEVAADKATQAVETVKNQTPQEIK